jgi:DNA-binding FrmR family transcriptional regulator
MVDTGRGYVTLRCMSTQPKGAAGPGYGATKDQLLKRLSRVEGQVRGVSRMVEQDRYCIDVLTQISAAQAALDKVALGLLDEHAKHCVADAGAADRDKKTDEMMAAVGRLLRRG